MKLNAASEMLPACAAPSLFQCLPLLGPLPKTRRTDHTTTFFMLLPPPGFRLPACFGEPPISLNLVLRVVWQDLTFFLNMHVLMIVCFSVVIFH